MRWLGLLGALLVLPGAALAQAPVAETAAVETGVLEESLRATAFDFDAVAFLGAERTLLMGIFETYCAVEFLIPPEEGVRALDVVLGAGCLIGAATLYVLGIRRLLHPEEKERAGARLVEYYEERRAGTLNPADFAERLAEAARRDRRRRWVRFGLGVLELGAVGTVAGLTARDRIERTAGASIAIGTAVLSILGLVHALIRSPAERAHERLMRAGPSAW